MIYYILVDIDANGNWNAGKPYPDKQLAFNSGAKYAGNTVTPYAQFVAIDLPATVTGVGTPDQVPVIDASAVKITAALTPAKVV